MKSVFLFLIVSTLVFSSCKYDVKPEFVRIDRIELGAISLRKMDFEADAIFTNGNDIGGKLSTENIDIYVDETLVGHLKAEEFNVPARDTFSIPLKGVISTSKILEKDDGNILGNILSIVKRKKVDVRLEGDIIFKKGPFSYTYKVNRTDKLDIKL